MGYIPKKTLEDLEYDEVLKRCSDFSITSLGKVEIMNLHPKTQTHEIIKGLSEVSEFRASFDSENRIPNHGFESMFDMFSIFLGYFSWCLFFYICFYTFILFLGSPPARPKLFVSIDSQTHPDETRS